MLKEQQIFCCDLPPKTVSLSFDDGPGETKGEGPGPRTLELGQYLADEGIGAAFFVIGERAELFPEVLRGLKEQGHLIGNHTMSHARLASLLASGKDPTQQIIQTNYVIQQIVGGDGEPILFRAPWGLWNDDLAKHFSQDPRMHQAVGPIAWDIPLQKGDWYYWDKNLSPEECAKAYFDEIEINGRGIIDLHDHSFENDLWPKNRTYEMVKLLVPMLKQAGYSFVRLDEIAEIKEAMEEAA